jgi:glycosyltransferase involved in cell wall biosynthesis
VTDVPLVSLLCPTRDRRRFLPQVLKLFRRQTWPADRLELVVVDDGRERTADLFEGDPRVRFEHLDVRVPLGTKRNRLVQLARGEILVHLDDDDWVPDDRVERAVRALQDTGADVVGRSDLVFWDLATGNLHRIPAIGPKHACAGTMAYRRSYAEAHPFAPEPHTEERQFLQNFEAKVAHLPGEPWETLVCLGHGGNALPKNTSLPRVPRAPADVVPDPDDRAFYQGLLEEDW